MDFVGLTGWAEVITSESSSVLSSTSYVFLSITYCSFAVYEWSFEQLVHVDNDFLVVVFDPIQDLVRLSFHSFVKDESDLTLKNFDVEQLHFRVYFYLVPERVDWSHLANILHVDVDHIRLICKTAL